MPYPGEFCVVLVPLKQPDVRLYVEASAGAWTLAAEQAQRLHPDCKVESVYPTRISVVGKCVRCGEWQEDAFAVATRKLCQDCR